jgi:hypothetical protein
MPRHLSTIVIFVLALGAASFSQDIRYSIQKSGHARLLVVNGGILNFSVANNSTVNLFPMLDVSCFLTKWLAVNGYAEYAFAGIFMNNYTAYHNGTDMPKNLEYFGATPAHDAFVKLGVSPCFTFDKLSGAVVLWSSYQSFNTERVSFIRAPIREVVVGADLDFYRRSSFIEHDLGFQNMSQSGFYGALSVRILQNYAISWNLTEGPVSPQSAVTRDFSIIKLYFGMYYSPAIKLTRVASYGFTADDEENGPYTSPMKNTGWEAGIDINKKIWFLSGAFGVLPGPEKQITISYKSYSDDFRYETVPFFIRFSLGMNFHRGY